MTILYTILIIFLLFIFKDFLVLSKATKNLINSYINIIPQSLSKYQKNKITTILEALPANIILAKKLNTLTLSYDRTDFPINYYYYFLSLKPYINRIKLLPMDKTIEIYSKIADEYNQPVGLRAYQFKLSEQIKNELLH